ncbi:E3 ubiquitin-protein ligase TRIM31 [Sciurus carolinensis]|uniref:E3 ubiquitin-protein ligase TRIM31 n=1 Tax=Sciurus carolinensis TaxID=30640 RepID=UPI001FB4D98C|nr:E3 ubiquitin-protein ligase TRIM31 [Sciurus carolinensis]
MASQQFSGNLKEEVICPICMDFLQDPATIDCGHNFCHKCIARIAEDSGRFLKCPLCNSSVKKTFRPNWLLVNLVKKIQAMGTSEEQPEGEELKCQKHGEKFYYFCEHDGDFLCVMCRESEDHRMHNASLIEEAAQNYQAQIQCQVEILQQTEKEMVQMKEQGEWKINDFMNHVKFEMIKILGEFSHLQQVLEEEKNFLLSRLHWLGQEGDQQRKLFTASMKLQWTALKKLIDSLKVKQQMLPSQLLEDIRATLHRSEEFQFLSPTLIPPHLEKKLSVAKSRHDSIIENMKKFEDNLQASGKKDKNRFLESMNEKDKQNWDETIKPGLSNPYPLTPSHALFEASFPGEAAPSASLLAGSRETYVEVPVNRASSEDAGSFGSESSERFKAVLTPVALDAASPHPDLILSQDLKTVTLPLHPQRRSEEPADQERFYPFPCVLGSPGISSGCQAWEAELQGGERAGCLVGVASELVCRRGCLLVEPLAGFWTLRITSLGCEALTDGGTRENLPIRPKKVGIFVDHELGEVVFFDSTTSNHIYTFHASFAGQIFPFFQLLYPGTQITLNP